MDDKIKAFECPCMTENHEVYIAGKGHVKIKDCLSGDVIINEVNGRTERFKISDIKIYKGAKVSGKVLS